MPLQLGQTLFNLVSAQSLQKVHSKLQITASPDSGGRSLLQHSQFGRSSNIFVVHLKLHQQEVANKYFTLPSFVGVHLNTQCLAYSLASFIDQSALDFSSIFAHHSGLPTLGAHDVNKPPMSISRNIVFIFHIPNN